MTSRWERSKKGDGDSKKIRVVIEFDPTDPKNENLLKFYDSIGYGKGNPTYLGILRDYADRKVKREASGTAKAPAAVTEKQQAAPEIKHQDVAPPAAAPMPVFKESKPIDEPAHQPVASPAIEPETEVQPADQSSNPSFSKNALGMFNLADD